LDRAFPVSENALANENAQVRPFTIFPADLGSFPIRSSPGGVSRLTVQSRNFETPESGSRAENESSCSALFINEILQ
jgi:hypothetical protein